MTHALTPSHAQASNAKLVEVRSQALILRAVSRQLGAMADTYEAQLIGNSDDAFDWEGENYNPDNKKRIKLARQIYCMRRRRDQIFGGRFFGEPGWDILLYLFIKSDEGGKARAKQVTAAASVPPTTALRWIGELIKAGLVERQASILDKRTHWLTLSPHGQDYTAGCLDAIAQAAQDSFEDEGRAFGWLKAEWNAPESLGQVPVKAEQKSQILASLSQSVQPLTLASLMDLAPLKALAVIRQSASQTAGVSLATIESTIERIGKPGARLLLALLEAPGHALPSAELIVAARCKDEAGLKRTLRRLLVALSAFGLERPLFKRRKAYELSPEAAVRIMEHLDGR